MSSKKLFRNGEAAREASVGRLGNQRTLGIVLALSGLATVALRRDLRDQQEALHGDLRDQQGRDHDQLVLVRSQLQDLMQWKHEQEAKTGRSLSPESPPGDVRSTEDWRRDDSATYWKSEEVHHRSKRNSEANKTILILGRRSDFGCLSGPPGPPGPPGQCSCPTLAAPTAPPQVTTPAAPTAPPQVTTPAAPTAPPQVTTPAAPTAPPADTDCAAYKAAGHTTSYTLGSPLSGVTVYCDMDTDGGGWTVIQRRMDGSVPFIKNWVEYKSGFGNKNGEYWLGNEIIHLLTAQKNYRLRIGMMGWDDEWRYAEYDTFRVSGESDGYRLTFSGYSGTAGDSMTGVYSNNDQKFSTVDRDNDVWCGGSCSQDYGQGGWWYKDCSLSFLNGRYLGNCGNSCTNGQGVMWYKWRGSTYSLKSVSMAIRPR
ncbi:Fibrinogen- domains (FReDs) [Branchiostoma belcheri]|nr:Fibrinogen- domains (FReDs) [Branchiostoma belcheri]